MLMISGLGLWAADWSDHLSVVPAVGVLGVAAGPVLGSSRFGRRSATLLALAYGTFVIGWQLGRVLGDSLIWHERILGTIGRVGAFVAVVWRGESNSDLLMFVLLMAGLYWAMGVHAAWAIVRHLALWQAALPAGLALMVKALARPGWSGTSAATSC